MHQPEFYQNNNNLQRRHAHECLQSYGNIIKWKKNARIIDVGSGDGSVTTTVLQKYLPADHSWIEGIDISKEMVKHSNMCYGNDKLHFSLMDIAGEVPKQLKGSFHHAFSFYVLHWVYNQEKAFANIYELLTEDGDCLVMFVQSSKLYEMCRAVARLKKWMPLLGRPDTDMVSRYHDMEEPEKELHRIMLNTGFKNVFIKCINLEHVYDDLDDLKKFVQALNPLNLPADCLEDFGKDAIQVFVDLGILEVVEAGLTFTSKQLVAYGKFVQALNPLNLPADCLEDFGKDAIQVFVDLGLLDVVKAGLKFTIKQWVSYGSK